MTDWPQHRIGDLIDAGVIVVHKDGNHGSNYPRAEDFGDHGLPFLTAKSLSDWKVDIDNAPRLSANKANKLTFGFVEPGDVLLSHNATVGRVAICPPLDGRAVIGTSLTQFRTDPNRLLPTYLALYLSSRQFQNELNAVMAQSTRNQVPITAQRRLSVALPPIEVQRATAELAFCLIDKIELNRRMNETLEAIARTIFRDWFVDFGPTRAQMEGRAPYLALDLWSLFPDTINDATGLPEGWADGALDDLCDLNPETWSAAHHPASVAYVDLSNTKWGNIESVEHFAWAEAPSRARRVLRPGDTIVGTVRPGNGSYAFVSEDDLTGSTGFAVLRAHQQFDQTFVWCASTSSENIERLAHLADGGAYPAVRPDVVAASPTVVAGDDVRVGFDRICRPLLERMERNKVENAVLGEARDYLLPKLMSGEIRVGDVLPEVEQVT